jgi:uncharacterized protein YbjT (DUF2867 family)
MYAVTGITGRVGGVAGRTLLDAGLSVRAVVRDAAKSTGVECRLQVIMPQAEILLHRRNARISRRSSSTG